VTSREIRLVECNEWQQQNYYNSKDPPATEEDKFIRNIKLPAHVLSWLDVSECVVSEAVFLKSGLVVNKEKHQTSYSYGRSKMSGWTNLKRKVFSSNYRPKDVKCLKA
jgi:hypothetical protein